MVLQALPQDTVRLIKSTQVITSPSSIVKELVENSIDAGATTISIRLENYGFSLLEVRDNGCGIGEGDVQFVAKPHFTSKIQTFADLASLTTYGFRGEALASLCAVAEVTITTKTKDSMIGRTFTLDQSGSVSTMKPAASPNGTSIVSRNLFKGLPVRRQYYSSTKRRKEELKKVEDLMFAFTLAAPGVHLTLSHDKCSVMQKASVKTVREALMSTFPAVYKDLVFRERHKEDIHIEVYLPGSGPRDNPNLSRTTPDRLFVLANQRPVIHKSIEKLVKAYYSQKFEGSHGRYPLGVVALTLPPGAMDVNLEPNKTKVLLNDEKEILEALQDILIELYGPLEPKKSNAEGSSDPFCDTEITCTFGGLTKDSDLEEENINKQKNMDDDFLDVSEDKFWSSSTNHIAAKKTGGGKAVLSKLGDRCGKTHEKDIFKKPVQVSNGEDYQGRNNFSIKRTTSDFTELNTIENTVGKDESLKSSEQGRMTKDITELITSGRNIAERYESMKSTDNNTTEKCESLKITDNKTTEKYESLKTADKNIAEKYENLKTTDDNTAGKYESLKTVDENTAEKYESLKTADEKTAEKDEGQKSKAIHTSTPNSLDPYFPSIPESSISPDDDLHFLHVSDSGAGKGAEDNISGIAPLPPSHTNALPESDDSGANHHTEENNETLPLANQDTGKLHESFTGSDGIPVYKIPPLPPIDTDQEPENDSPAGDIQVIDGNSDKNPAEKAPVLATDWGDILLSGADIDEVQLKPDPQKDKISAGSWSRGMPVNGKNIQTVQLKTAANKATKPFGSTSRQSDAGKTGKRQASAESGRSSAAPPKKRMNYLGPHGYDYYYGKPVKKPSTPFLLFSRDVRHKVLSEHPGADFAFIAKEMAERWKALDQEKKDYYKDLSTAEAERYQREVRQIRESRGDYGDSPVAKGCKTGASLDRFLAPVTPYIARKKEVVIKKQPLVSDRPWLQHSKDVKCSVKIITEKIKKRHSMKSKADVLTILGRVTDSGGWVCVQGSDIMTLNVYRIHEVILTISLMKAFQFSVKPLDNPLPFNSSSVGLDNWAAVLKLPRELVPHRNFYCVTDQRLTANGFNVVLFPGTTSNVTISHGEITEMTNVVGFYGITDLKEILSIVAASPRATLEQTRPLKLQNWIRAEAVRMVRSQPNILEEDKVIDKVRKLRLLYPCPEGETQEFTEMKCIHGRPLFTKLYPRDDLPMPPRDDVLMSQAESQAEAYLNPGD